MPPVFFFLGVKGVKRVRDIGTGGREEGAGGRRKEKEGGGKGSRAEAGRRFLLFYSSEAFPHESDPAFKRVSTGYPTIIRHIIYTI